MSLVYFKLSLDHKIYVVVDMALDEDVLFPYVVLFLEKVAKMS